MPKVVGIDLAGKPENPTGFCLLEENKTSVRVLFSDEEILKEAEAAKPDIIAIDAPFSFPAEGYFRDSEKKLQELGFKCLSPKFPGMQPLVRRAVALVSQLGGKGYSVIEVFPHATEKILGIGMAEKANEHEYDAMLCALTGKYFLEGKCVEIGKEKIIIPKL